MKLAQLELEVTEFVLQNTDLHFCKPGFCSIIKDSFGFILPRKFSKIWLALHTAPHKDRKKLKILESEFGNWPVIEFISFDGKITTLSFIEIDNILKPLIGQTVYLQVEYEA